MMEPGSAAKKFVIHSPQSLLIKGFEGFFADRLQNWDFCHTPSPTPLKCWLAEAARIQPNVILVDCMERVPKQLLVLLRKSLPESQILIWLHEPNLNIANYSRGLGIRGIVKSDITEDLLVRCMERVSTGELWYDRSVTEGLMNSIQIQLSRREHQLLVAVSKGLPNKEIANVLGLSEGTVKFYLSRLFRKCSVFDRLELALFGLRYLFNQPGMNEEDELHNLNMPAVLFVEPGNGAHAPRAE
jgi:DNA-binding NarL/FixJ family response regulator